MLESFEVRFPAEKDSKSTNDLMGLREYEIGRCHEMLGHRELALAAFLHATKINPTVSKKTDIVRRIERLGGVQLDNNRDVDVQSYILFLAAIGRDLFPTRILPRAHTKIPKTSSPRPREIFPTCIWPPMDTSSISAANRGCVFSTSPINPGSRRRQSPCR